MKSRRTTTQPVELISCNPAICLVKSRGTSLTVRQAETSKDWAFTLAGPSELTIQIGIV